MSIYIAHRRNYLYNLSDDSIVWCIVLLMVRWRLWFGAGEAGTARLFVFIRRVSV